MTHISANWAHRHPTVKAFIQKPMRSGANSNLLPYLLWGPNAPRNLPKTTPERSKNTPETLDLRGFCIKALGFRPFNAPPLSARFWAPFSPPIGPLEGPYRRYEYVARGCRQRRPLRRLRTEQHGEALGERVDASVDASRKPVAKRRLLSPVAVQPLGKMISLVSCFLKIWVSFWPKLAPGLLFKGQARTTI